MKSHPSLVSPLAMAAFIGLLALPASAKQPSIELERIGEPAQVGQRGKVKSVVEVDERAVFKESGKSKKKRERFKLVLQGVQTVKALHDNGAPSKVTLKIKGFHKHQAGQKKRLLKPGTLVTASGGPSNKAFEVDGLPADPEMASLLASVFGVAGPDANDDDVLGLPAKRRVGETWTLEARVVAKAMSASGVRVWPEDVGGQAKLVGVKRRKGGAVVHIRAKLRVKKFTPPLPRGLTRDRATISSTIDYWIPRNLANVPLRMQSKTTVEFAGSGKT